MSDSCGINDKNTSCCSSPSEEAKNLGEYWCDIYTDADISTLGWYEKESKPSLELITQCNLAKNATMFNPGCGASTLIDSLLDLDYSNIIANDISSCALNKIKKRIDTKVEQVKWFVEDLTKPMALLDLPQLDLWHDRAVLHFFIDEKDQNTYFDLLKSKVKTKGFVILATFNLQGATTCSGLPVNRYNSKMLQEKLGADFKLIHNFDYIYTMPNGEERTYIYTLFQRN
jgi:hypothetical protein